MTPWRADAAEDSDRWSTLLPRRTLGSTGERVTLLGVGGYHIGWTTERDAQEVIETAIAGGVRFFDTAHNYGKGESEKRYGRFLVPTYRDDIFLMTKTQATDKATAIAEIEASLRRLHTDRVDLLQIHSLFTAEDVDERIANGAFDAVEEALAQGKARYIGFTGHQNPAAQERLLDRWADCPAFAACQFPINVLDVASRQSFVKRVLPRATQKQLGILAMKTLADGRFFNQKVMNKKVRWETDDPVVPGRISIEHALHFAWSLPISTLITGAETAAFLEEKIQFAHSFVAQTPQARTALIDRVADLAEAGKVEYYKKA
jgi:aryl-alcohol dehydrogenase-like predicted oxidoreductase